MGQPQCLAEKHVAIEWFIKLLNENLKARPLLHWRGTAGEVFYASQIYY